MSTDNGDAVFDECVADIERAYKDLGHTLGWRFIGVSKRVLRAPVRIAFIALNPGGDYDPPDHPHASRETGNWYISETWGGKPAGQSKLQRQVRLMFGLVAEAVNYGGEPDELINESLVGNFIPFRSPSIAKLPRRRESMAFACSVWTRVLSCVRPKLIICIGRDTQKNLDSLIRHQLGMASGDCISMSTGWGTRTATLQTYGNGTESMRLLTLPHLSRFTIFTSQKCVVQARAIIEAACHDL